LDLALHKGKIFAAISKQMPLFVRFSTVAGEGGAADATKPEIGTRLSCARADG